MMLQYELLTLRRSWSCLSLAKISKKLILTLSELFEIDSMKVRRVTKNEIIQRISTS